MLIDEEEMTSMRELVEQIDAHVELDEMEATSIPRVGDQPGGDLFSPATDQQQTKTVTQTEPTDPTTWLPNRIPIAFIYFYCLLIFYHF